LGSRHVRRTAAAAAAAAAAGSGDGTARPRYGSGGGGRRRYSVSWDGDGGGEDVTRSGFVGGKSEGLPGRRPSWSESGQIVVK
jgi:hypothetical protein